MSAARPGRSRRAPGFVWIPPYGRESLLPNAYGTREGFVSLSFNFFGHEAFHQEKYVTARGSKGTGSAGNIGESEGVTSRRVSS